MEKKSRIPWNKGLKGVQIAWNKGLTSKTDKRVEKMSRSKTGQKRSQEARLRMRNAQLGKKQTKEQIEKRVSQFRGIPRSDDTKQKISVANSGKTYTMSKSRKEKIRLGTIKRIERQKFNGLPMIPCIGKYETQILDNIEKILEYKIIRQYRVAGYFIDGYCQLLNLAIEIDESHHNNERCIIKDIKREAEIKNILHCSFLRLNGGV